MHSQIKSLGHQWDRPLFSFFLKNLTNIISVLILTPCDTFHLQLCHSQKNLTSHIHLKKED